MHPTARKGARALAALAIAASTATGVSAATSSGAIASSPARSADPTITVLTSGDRETSSAGATTVGGSPPQTTGGTVTEVQGVTYSISPATTTGQSQCTSNGAGSCVFNGAQSGVTYTITQTGAPAGYFLNPALGVGAATTPSTSVATVYKSIQLTVGTSNLTVPFTTAVGANNDQTRSGRWAVSRFNPPGPQACENKVALIFDLSASISASDLAIYKTAAEGFVRALLGVNVDVKLFTFGTTAPAPGSGNSGFTEVNTLTAAGVETLIRQINGLTLPASAQFTNWDRGLFQVHSQGFNEAIMLTDGDPTAYGTNGASLSGSIARTRFRDVEAGIFSANALKAEGTRVIAVGLDSGSSGSIANLKAISGPTEGSDFFSLPFNSEQFTSLLKDLALLHCAGLSIEKSASPQTFAVGDTIHYTYTVTNTAPEGGFALHDITVTDDQVSAAITNCVHADGTGAITTANPLRPGQQATCTATRVTTQADVNAGHIVNTATASGKTPNNDPVGSGPDEAEVIAPRQPALTITKVGSPNPFDMAGQVITYAFQVRNTGNVTLRNVTVTDPSVSDLACTPENGTATLLPGDEMTCTATRVVTQSDLNNGFITNTAHATGTPPPGLNPPDPGATETIDGEGGGAITIVKTANPTIFNENTQTITYTFDIENTGTVTLHDIQLADDNAAIGTCEPPLGSSLEPGGVMQCTAMHMVTAADLAAGQILNTATVTGETDTGETKTEQDTAEVNEVGRPAISLQKSTDPAVFYTTAGETITYHFTLTNTGSGTLSNVQVNDTAIQNIQCTPALGDSLPQGGVMMCTGTHEVTQADIDAGQLSNVAVARGTGENGMEVMDDDHVTVFADVVRGISVTKAGSPQTYTTPGQVITYTYTVTNVGNVTLHNVTLTDPAVGNLTCEPPNGTATLTPHGTAGDTMTCTATHTVTQADIDAGSVDNTGTATGHPEEGDPVTDAADESVFATIIQQLKLAKSASPTTFSMPGQLITYTFTVTNASNVTLAGVTLTDNRLGTISCPERVLAPGQQMTCTATRMVSQADFDTGSIANTAMAAGTNPAGTPVVSLPARALVTVTVLPVVPVTG